MNKNFDFGESTFKQRLKQQEIAKAESLQADFLQLNFDGICKFFDAYKRFVGEFNSQALPELKTKRAELVATRKNKKQEINSKKSVLTNKKIVSNVIEERMNDKFRVFAIINLNNDYRKREEIDLLDVSQSEKSSLLTRLKAEDEYLGILQDELSKKTNNLNELLANKKQKFLHPFKFRDEKEELEYAIDLLKSKINRTQRNITKLKYVCEYINNLSPESKDLIIETFALASECFELEKQIKQIDCEIENLKNYNNENLTFAKFVKTKNLNGNLNELLPLLQFVKKYRKLLASPNIDNYINLRGLQKEILKFFDEFSVQTTELDK